ncbi:hypothetical protein G6F40_016683 [Rhizopus arrhizus]|nr:hypothetical protein G6F40_016683 [Rhizopus arrhizus]
MASPVERQTSQADFSVSSGSVAATAGRSTMSGLPALRIPTLLSPVKGPLESDLSLLSRVMCPVSLERTCVCGLHDADVLPLRFANPSNEIAIPLTVRDLRQ